MPVRFETSAEDPWLNAVLITTSAPMRADAIEQVLLPGEPERRSAERRTREGIPVDDGTWRDVLEAAAKLGITQGEIDRAVASNA